MTIHWIVPLKYMQYVKNIGLHDVYYTDKIRFCGLFVLKQDISSKQISIVLSRDAFHLDVALQTNSICSVSCLPAIC